MSKSRKGGMAATHTRHAKRTVAKVRSGQQRQREKYERKKLLRDASSLVLDGRSYVQFMGTEEDLQTLLRRWDATTAKTYAGVEGDIYVHTASGDVIVVEAKVHAAASVGTAEESQPLQEAETERSVVQCRESPDSMFVQPPHRAEYLLYLFLEPADREALPGDLCEEFNQIILPRFGGSKARMWYWAQVVRSIGWMLTLKIGRLFRRALFAEAATSLWRKYIA